MEGACQPLDLFLKKVTHFEEVLKLTPDEFVAKYDKPDNPKPVEFILEEINKYKAEKEKIENALLPTIQVSCFLVDCKELIKHLKSTYKSLISALTEIIARRYAHKGQDIDAKYREMKAKIETDPQDVESLTEIQQFIEMEMPGRIQMLRNESSEVMRVYDILGDMYYKVPESELDTRLQINYKYPTDMDDLVTRRLKDLEQKKKKLLEEMKTEQNDFEQRIANLEKKITNYYHNTDPNKHRQYYEEVCRIDAELAECHQKATKFNSREELFGKDRQDYTKIGSLIKEFDHYLSLWKIVHQWSTGIVDWTQGPWEKVNAIQAQDFVENNSKKLSDVMKHFRERDSYTYANQITIAETYKKKIDEFKPKVPLLVALRMQGMEDRHWEEISNRAQKKINPNEISGFNFEWVLNQGFLTDVAICQEVGDRAYREYKIKSNLDEMIEKWKNLNFKTVQYKNTSHSIIQGFDEVESVLDQDLSSTGAMIVNPFNKFYEKDIITWSEKMRTVANAVDEWRRFQGKWMYLQPIFEGGDISKHLSEETAKFKKIHQDAKSKVESVKKNPNALEACTEGNTAEMLKTNNAALEEIQNALNQYLEMKRSKFARFYFLSDDDLLSILSEVKEVERVQEHLRKVFENVNRLQFDQEKQILAMFSVEGEKVNFIESLDPVGKQVEDWMSEVEVMMKKSVRDEFIKAVKTYTPEGRVRWFFEHPGQCSLNGSQVHWTREVEEAIQKGKVKDYVQKLNSQIIEMVKLDRSSFTLMKNVTIEALIVIDVHAKEVVETLEKTSVKDIGAFEWISQLRYYWEKDDCYVKCIQTNFPYGYEYLGNTTRLVITPLTDKCYMTLMGAIKLNLGGAPAGPAGTGKTESTKDLAKALAKQCVVFNCQESMDIKFVAKFFKGLACSGAWCCFDEFNRINIEVLSVIAQQLQDLFTAKAMGITEMRFDDTQIKVLPTFSVFITMNPGYAGRTELPDNLKALFRPMAMMVPDYALIGQIKFCRSTYLKFNLNSSYSRSDLQLHPSLPKRWSLHSS